MVLIKKIIHRWSWVLLIAFCTIGLINPYIGTAALICMFAPIVVAFFRGRMWCGNFCPRGSFNDVILSRFSCKKAVPKFLKSTWFRNLFLVLLMGEFAIQLAIARGDALAVGKVFVRMIILTTLLTIILGISFNQRTWCIICPMGTMAHYVAKIKVLKAKFKHVNFRKNTCINCRICSKSCPMEIDVFNYKKLGKVIDANCIKCNGCVEKCPKKSLFIA